METILEQIADLNPDAVILDGLDKAIVGICYKMGQQPVLLYDKNLCIQVLIERDKMLEEEAEEVLEFNTYNLWAGEGTPCFTKLNKILPLNKK